MFKERIGVRECGIDHKGQGGPVLWWGLREQEDPCRTAELLRRKTGGRNYVLIAYPVEDWNRDFSPWPAVGLSGDREFPGQGKETLRWLLDQGLPWADREYFPGKEKPFHYVAGYSLAGLFSLWAFYESGRFAGAASCSGSLWFPGWERFAEAHSAPAESRIYLSLGVKEEKTGNPLMAQVGDATRKQYERIRGDRNVDLHALEWKGGGHFTDPAGRMAEGMAWLLTADGGKK